MMMKKTALNDRADVVQSFVKDGRARLRKLAMELAIGVTRDDPCRAAMRPDEIDSVVAKIVSEAGYIRAHVVAECELRGMANGIFKGGKA